MEKVVDSANYSLLWIYRMKCNVPWSKNIVDSSVQDESWEVEHLIVFSGFENVKKMYKAEDSSLY